MVIGCSKKLKRIYSKGYSLKMYHEELKIKCFSCYQEAAKDLGYWHTDLP